VPECTFFNLWPITNELVELRFRNSVHGIISTLHYMSESIDDVTHSMSMAL
jgi:hypothetical protein